MARVKTIGNRIAPVRFLIFLAVLVAGWAVLPALLGFERGFLAGFDIAALAFLGSCVPLLKLGAVQLRGAAEKNDANRWMLLAISFVLTVVVLGAITVQLAAVESLKQPTSC